MDGDDRMPPAASPVTENAPAAPFSALSASLQWRILDTLYGQARSLVSAAPAILLCGGFAFARTDSRWLLVWMAASLTVLIARAFWMRAYHRRPHTETPALWLRRFELGAWASSILWGAAGIALLTERDTMVPLMIINVQSGYTLAAAVRNSAVPKIALAQVYLVLGPTVLCCLILNGTLYFTYALLLMIYIGASRAIVHRLGQQTLILLIARERMSGLIEESERSNIQLATANAKLERLANIDGLTGIANRRSLDATLARCWRQGLRNSAPLSLLLLDIDHFKLFNDSLGHQAGDECLREIAGAVEQMASRPEDHVARYGGEEFAVILPDTDTMGAVAVAERIRAAITALMIPHPLSGAGFVTASIGVATFCPSSDQTPEIMLALADQALYGAKLAGRNRLHSATRVTLPD